MQGAAKLKGWLQITATVALVSLLAACGGGGGSSNNSSSSSSSSSSSETAGLPASPTAQPIAATASNTVAVTVGQGVASVINIPTVTVTVCAPNSSNCQTISNVQVDTGSYGLRIASGVLSVALPNAAVPNGSGTLVECTNFADGYSWGSVRTATVQISGETATSIPVQVLGDVNFSVPTSCASGTEENSPSALGANGILGIGVAPVDCGSTCASASTAAQYSNYYACSGSSCSQTQVPDSDQVTNPVSKFATDNNGVIVQMPPISSTGAGSATGTLVFGIGTQSNNTLAAAKTFTTDDYGDLNNSTFNGTTLAAFFDSGSNSYFFTDSALALCGSTYSGFYCPSTGQTLSVNLVGLNGASATASIGVLSAATLFSNSSNYAFNDLAGQIGGSDSFDIGLPFFYGRYMYFGISSSSQSPYVGY
ncbi:MAG: DUF3443 domain-containing protein [Pseudomonadota bacterium]|jgi:hypothetical protein|uniref:DUF3443 domain-containing protein n=1 Tax=Burkholderiaceae TaxID=119060 RepID=UPI0010F9B431|nr:DUF3443 domain-containing protein [Burkholderia sp. 4M9327F10]